ncbi:MAG: hypothetical protein ACQERN_04115 [Thermodesulfobacteriota bacterium]
MSEIAPFAEKAVHLSRVKNFSLFEGASPSLRNSAGRMNRAAKGARANKFLFRVPVSQKINKWDFFQNRHLQVFVLPSINSTGFCQICAARPAMKPYLKSPTNVNAPQ